jgi:hypothetical protein
LNNLIFTPRIAVLFRANLSQVLPPEVASGAAAAAAKYLRETNAAGQEAPGKDDPRALAAVALAAAGEQAARLAETEVRRVFDR